VQIKLSVQWTHDIVSYVTMLWSSSSFVCIGWTPSSPHDNPHDMNTCTSLEKVHTLIQSSIFILYNREYIKDRDGVTEREKWLVALHW